MATTEPHDTDRAGDVPRPTPGAGARDVTARRPYPTAATVTRLSPARATGTAPARRVRAASAVPATVWTIYVDTATRTVGRLVPTVARVLTAFAAPGAAVAFLPWPVTSVTQPESGEPDTAGRRDELVIDIATGAAMVAAARSAGYAARLITAPTTPVPDSGPAGDLENADGAHPVWQPAVQVHPSSLDLIVTATGPGGIDEPSADRVALLAARALRTGGILAVLTHSDHDEAGLRDRAGTVVTAAQSADLLYLQHVVAVHGPIHHLETDPAALDERDPHRRVHDDLLVLVQPRDHALDLANAVAA